MRLLDKYFGKHVNHWLLYFSLLLLVLYPHILLESQQKNTLKFNSFARCVFSLRSVLAPIPSTAMHSSSLPSLFPSGSSLHLFFHTQEFLLFVLYIDLVYYAIPYCWSLSTRVWISDRLGCVGYQLVLEQAQDCGRSLMIFFD